MEPLPLVVLISGLDPTGGAGLMADIRGASAAGVRIAPIISSTTVQSPGGVDQVFPIPSSVIQKQLEMISAFFEPVALKIGLTGSEDTIRIIVQWLHQHSGIKVVLDPIHTASAGGLLTSESQRKTLIEVLSSYVTLITPNYNELFWLTGIDPLESNMEPAIRKLHHAGFTSILLKGGHRRGKPMDILSVSGRITRFESSRLSGNVRGTGCHLSSFITAELAQNTSMVDSIKKGRKFVRSLFTRYNKVKMTLIPAWKGESVNADEKKQIE